MGYFKYLFGFKSKYRKIVNYNIRFFGFKALPVKKTIYRNKHNRIKHKGLIWKLFK